MASSAAAASTYAAISAASSPIPDAFARGEGGVLSNRTTKR
jgi:hypothetical protein